MYIDFLKNDYSDKPNDEQQAYIERDKKHLGAIIQERVANDIENIVNRLYELDDIGCISENEKFLYLLNKAEQLYSFAYYTGTISIVGIASEEYCKYLINKNNISDVEKQVDRINKLAENSLINDYIKVSLHEIRKIRNRCMHYNVDFKNLTINQLQNNALNILQLFKECLAPLSIDNVNLVQKNIFESKEMLFKDFVFRNRNVLRKQEKLDLQISPDVENLIFTSQYYIAEIDIDGTDFKEMTLVDMNRIGIPVVIDLTLPQSDMIKAMKLQDGNIIIATILSSITTIGQTEEWHLLSIKDVFYGVILIEELKNFI